MDFWDLRQPEESGKSTDEADQQEPWQVAGDGEIPVKVAVEGIAAGEKKPLSVIECNFEQELGIHAKLCLLFSRRGVLPQKIVFREQKLRATGDERSDQSRNQGFLGFRSDRGIMYAEFHASQEQLDSIVRELRKTVGVHGTRIGVP